MFGSELEQRESLLITNTTYLLSQNTEKWEEHVLESKPTA